MVSVTELPLGLVVVLTVEPSLPVVVSTTVPSDLVSVLWWTEPSALVVVARLAGRGGTAAATAAGADRVEGKARRWPWCNWPRSRHSGEDPLVGGVRLDLGGVRQLLPSLSTHWIIAGGPAGVGLQVGVRQRLIRGGDPGVDGIAGGLRLC